MQKLEKIFEFSMEIIHQQGGEQNNHLSKLDQKPTIYFLLGFTGSGDPFPFEYAFFQQVQAGKACTVQRYDTEKNNLKKRMLPDVYREK